VAADCPNTMGFFGKAGAYLSNLWDFVWDDPRESNTEGGVFPAIFGIVMMVLIMSVFVTPLGVLAALPSPTFGTGGILWASLTLALLTVPVVIVSTEEGLAAIPRGLREASLALGATKWETTWRVVLPSLMPSVLTGLILAMARAAGEVAPLMLTGVVKLAPTLPIDSYAPYLHLDRKFMHLGFHIYDVGFQSPNVDAARPMVFTTALLLLVIVVALNMTAIVLRKRFAGAVI
jgi:phosphate transport system permease protein